jgi:hypothetical protein
MSFYVAINLLVTRFAANPIMITEHDYILILYAATQPKQIIHSFLINFVVLSFSLFQSEFSMKRDLVLSFSIFNILCSS